MIIYFCLFYIWPVKNLEQIGKRTNAAVSFCTSFRMSTCVYVMSSEGECEAPFRCLHEIFETVHSHNTYASSVSNQSRKATTVGVSGASSMLALVRAMPNFCKAQHLKHTRDLCFTLFHVVLLQEYNTGNKYQNNSSR